MDAVSFGPLERGDRVQKQEKWETEDFIN